MRSYQQTWNTSLLLEERQKGHVIRDWIETDKEVEATEMEF
jgi:hypothetical protein